MNAFIEQAKVVPIVEVIGTRVALKKDGREFKALCPFHAERTPSFTVVPSKGRGFYFCHGCGAHGDAIKFVMVNDGVEFVEACRRITGAITPGVKIIVPLPSEDDAETRHRMIGYALKLWNASRPAPGTLVQAYLASRGLSDIAIPPSIRFHGSVKHPQDQRRHPCMISAIQDSQRKIVGIHRTYLRDDGSGKADVDAQKLTLGQKQNCHIRLCHSSERLALAEGIETALSIRKASPALSVWSVIDLGNFGAPVPDGVKEIIMCADADNKDQDMAERRMKEAAARLRRSGRRIRIARPPLGMDFNDWLRRLAA